MQPTKHVQKKKKKQQTTTALRVCKVKVKAVLYKVNYFIYKIHFHSKFIDYSNINRQKMFASNQNSSFNK